MMTINDITVYRIGEIFSSGAQVQQCLRRGRGGVDERVVAIPIEDSDGRIYLVK